MGCFDYEGEQRFRCWGGRFPSSHLTFVAYNRNGIPKQLGHEDQGLEIFFLESDATSRDGGIFVLGLGLFVRGPAKTEGAIQK